MLRIQKKITQGKNMIKMVGGYDSHQRQTLSQRGPRAEHCPLSPTHTPHPRPRKLLKIGLNPAHF